MWYTNGNGLFYQGDMQPGDRTATDAEAAAWKAANPPTYTYNAFITALTDAELALCVASVDAKVRVFLTRGQSVSLTGAQIKTMTNYLVTLSVLTAARATTIQGAFP